MIRNIVFDMGNVLQGWQPSAFALKAAGNEEDARLLAAALFERPEWAMGDEGTVSREEILRLALLSLPERLHGALRYLEENWPLWMPEIAGAADFVRRVKTAGLGAYVLSNANTRFPRAVERREAFLLMDGMLFSAHDRLVKPDPAIYRLFCSRFSLSPEECFFIDDLPQNVAGARSVGMRGMVFEGSFDAVAAALDELGVRL